MARSVASAMPARPSHFIRQGVRAEAEDRGRPPRTQWRDTSPPGGDGSASAAEASLAKWSAQGRPAPSRATDDVATGMMRVAGTQAAIGVGILRVAVTRVTASSERGLTKPAAPWIPGIAAK